MTKKIAYILFCQFMVLAAIASGCTGNTRAQKPKKDSAPVKQQASVAAKVNTPVNNDDEQQFRSFLKKFKNAVKKGDRSQLKAMLYFPLQTLPQWTSEDLKAATINPAGGLLTAAEYPQYAADIFSKDALRLIPQSREDDLSEIDNNTTENYYNTIKKVTDNGSTLYELQQQYEQKNSKETSYGFVFGKIKGQYKVISYFCPWPLKG